MERSEELMIGIFFDIFQMTLNFLENLTNFRNLKFNGFQKFNTKQLFEKSKISTFFKNSLK